jgi:hypothetical protein
LTAVSATTARVITETVTATDQAGASQLIHRFVLKVQPL